MTSTDQAAKRGIRSLVQHGIGWSIVQNWGGKVMTFGLSVLLARLLSPEEFGIASSAMLLLTLASMIAELGFGDAIMQRQGLANSELNLPFYVSLGAAGFAFAVVFAFSAELGGLLNVRGFDAYILVASSIVVLNVPTMFQESVYKRNLKFRYLALRTFIANLFGGATAVICAILGFGIWSFVVQAYAVSFISLLWLWWRPQWVPGVRLDIRAFRQMVRFGGPVLGQRLVDYAGTRFVDFLILGKMGLAAYGLYVVGSKLYTTMLQLLQGALYDVSLTVLSTIASDRGRLSRVYQKTVRLSASLVSPVFVAMAALSPEICSTLFGASWDGVDRVAGPLLLLGAVQCVQYMNGAFLASRGRPELTLLTGLVKSVTAFVFLIIFPAESVGSIAEVFVISQLVATPLSFLLTYRELGLSLTRLPFIVFPSAAACAAGYFGVAVLRGYLGNFGLSAVLQAGVLGAVFGCFWTATMLVLDWRGLAEIVRVIRRRGEREEF